jgi:hypothetical protein
MLARVGRVPYGIRVSPAPQQGLHGLSGLALWFGLVNNILILPACISGSTDARTHFRGVYKMRLVRLVTYKMRPI